MVSLVPLLIGVLALRVSIASVGLLLVLFLIPAARLHRRSRVLGY